MGYFDPEPKKSRSDFFNMEDKIEELKKAKLIVVEGLRRYGKTSLILTTLNELHAEYLYLDCRPLPSGMLSIDDIMLLLEGEIRSKPWLRSIAESIEAIEVGPLGVKFKHRNYHTLVEILENLKGKVLVLDEAQELRRCKYRFDALLAYLYDHVQVRIIVSGSQIGLLHRFLRVNDPSAPLYGKPFLRIELTPLSREQARQFLEEGFQQEGVTPPPQLIEKALNLLNGVIGWLTYLGNAYTRLGIKNLDKILESAAKLAHQELSHALQTTGIGKPRYTAILKITAERGQASWTEIKRYIESKLGKIPNNTLSYMLKNLIDMGLLQKTASGYKVPDPILTHAIKNYL